MKHVLVELPEPIGDIGESAPCWIMTTEGVEYTDAYFDHGIDYDNLDWDVVDADPFRGWYIDDGEKKIQNVEYWEEM